FRDDVKGALNLYRAAPEEFSNDEIMVIEELTHLIPPLYQALHDKVSLELISSINDKLHEAAFIDTNARTPVNIKSVIQSIFELVTEAFQCIETSIFLEDPFVAPNEYGLVASTWMEPLKKTVYRNRAHEGLTGWVLEHARPLSIFDLAKF